MTVAERVRSILDRNPGLAEFARGGGGAKGGGKKGKAAAKAKAKGAVQVSKGGLCCKGEGGKFAPGNNYGSKGGAKSSQRAAAQRVRERLAVKGKSEQERAAVEKRQARNRQARERRTAKKESAAATRSERVRQMNVRVAAIRAEGKARAEAAAKAKAPMKAEGRGTPKRDAMAARIRIERGKERAMRADVARKQADAAAAKSAKPMTPREIERGLASKDPAVRRKATDAMVERRRAKDDAANVKRLQREADKDVRLTAKQVAKAKEKLETAKGDPKAREAAGVVGILQRQKDAASAKVTALKAERDAALAKAQAGKSKGGPPADTMPIRDFAAKVVKAAERGKAGWFGDSKVMISSAYARVKNDPAFKGMSLARFKERLIEAHGARALELGRGDLIAAIDRRTLKPSTTPHLGAEYHFVRTAEGARPVRGSIAAAGRKAVGRGTPERAAMAKELRERRNYAAQIRSAREAQKRDIKAKVANRPPTPPSPPRTKPVVTPVSRRSTSPFHPTGQTIPSHINPVTQRGGARSADRHEAQRKADAARAQEKAAAERTKSAAAGRKAVGRGTPERAAKAAALRTGRAESAGGRREATVLRKIDTAYYKASGGQENVRVRIADIRESLKGIPRAEQDRILMKLATSDRAALYRLDNPREITSRDREAVWRTPSGEERHILYMSGRAPSAVAGRKAAAKATTRPERTAQDKAEKISSLAKRAFKRAQELDRQSLNRIGSGSVIGGRSKPGTAAAAKKLRRRADVARERGSALQRQADQLRRRARA